MTEPFAITRQTMLRQMHMMTRTNPERFDGFEKAGFLVDRYGDFTHNTLERFGGHYIDTGASVKVARGDIKVKAAEVGRLTETGIEFTDGSHLKADLIVCCTGFVEDFRQGTRKILGDVADVVDDYTGFDAEGEIRGLGKLAGRKSCIVLLLVRLKLTAYFIDPNLWYHGGDVRMARWWSRFIALKIQEMKQIFP